MKDLNLAVKAAKIASAILKEHFAEPAVSVKGAKDVITKADTGAEKAIRGFLLGRTDYGFLGEETGIKKGNPTWIVDPIDGTRPFCFGIPHFSTSIALMDGKDTMLGAVCNPMAGEMYTAVKGKGAFMNSRKLSVRNERPLKEALVSCAFVYGRKELHKLEASVNVCMLNFSCALDVCMVASGRTDAAVYGLTKVYDHSAAALIARETGITVTNFGTKGWDPYAMGIIAAKPGIRSELSRMFPKPLENLGANEKIWVKK